jgi:hypothetical protein
VLPRSPAAARAGVHAPLVPPSNLRPHHPWSLLRTALLPLVPPSNRTIPRPSSCAHHPWSPNCCYGVTMTWQCGRVAEHRVAAAEAVRHAGRQGRAVLVAFECGGWTEGALARGALLQARRRHAAESARGRHQRAAHVPPRVAWIRCVATLHGTPRIPSPPHQPVAPRGRCVAHGWRRGARMAAGTRLVLRRLIHALGGAPRR